MKTTAKQAGEQLRLIVMKLKAGADYEVCRKDAEPYIKIINDRAIELAREFSVKPKLITFSSYAR